MSFVSCEESETQLLTAMLSQYVEEMGVSQRFMTLASMTPPAEITYLTKVVARNLQVDNAKIALAPWSIQASKNGDAFLTVSQPLDQSKELVVAVAPKSNQLFVLAVTSFDRKFHEFKRINDGISNRKPIITLVIDGQRYKGEAAENYSMNVSAKTLQVGSISVFPLTALRALQQAKKITIYDDFPRAFSDGSINTDLSTDGLSHAYPVDTQGTTCSGYGSSRADESSPA